ncbi:hypothetical protein BCR33DRAFT_722560 [Rhizoclosmatium globosum]|uniref:Bulb-type lectin domain-containing protein n=1 Tax=Rhizoclosmatium globosum TaxID=329046 RepID=A0A1Y2BKA6_9FUNG|nr:hypothetical protein BCR33DRAFT_722560 [Rhizoclosmatium globosum]|eukprot:ORY35216.1 hypothetical protein BCR33DRAFT_722560 [Rhizoclosmatium globosum]
MPSLAVFVVVALSGIQGALAQTCENLGSWQPSWKLNAQYTSTPGYSIKGDSFKNCLQPYYSAPPCAKLSNPAGTSQLLMQPDGNAVIYSVWYATNCNQGRGCVSPIWSSQTWNRPGLSFRVQDGRFVLSTTPDLSGQVVWGTKAGSVAGTQLCMQNDSNLVLYDGATPVWASGN